MTLGGLRFGGMLLWVPMKGSNVSECPVFFFWECGQFFFRLMRCFADAFRGRIGNGVVESLDVGVGLLNGLSDEPNPLIPREDDGRELVISIIGDAARSKIICAILW